MSSATIHPSTVRSRELADLGAMVLEAPCLAAGYQDILHQCADWFHLDQAVRVQESRTLDPRRAEPTLFCNGLQPVSPELLAASGKYRAANPMLRTMIQHADLSPRQVSEFIPRREWQRNSFYHEVCIPMGLRGVMAVELTQNVAQNSRIHALVLGRDDRRGFSAEEYAWLEQVRWALRPILSFREKQEALSSVSPLTAKLTRREREVCHWLSRGKSNAEIGIILGCATRTVEKHVEKILFKTGLETRHAVIANFTRRPP